MKHTALGMIILVVAATADARPKGKSKQSVQAHMERAAKAHKQGNYELALGELQAAYALEAQPKLLYAIAQVYAKLDNCTAAIEHYEQFLAAVKDRSKQAVARQAIDACKQRLAEKPDSPEPVEAVVEPPPSEPPPSEPEPPATEPPPVEAPPPGPIAVEPPARAVPAEEPAPAVITRTTHSPWYRDVLGDALVIGGVAAAVGSIVIYRGARSDLDSAETTTTLDGYTEYRDSAERKQLYTFVLAGTGAALVTAGVLRYALRDSRRETRGVAIVPTGSGGLITWSGGF